MIVFLLKFEDPAFNCPNLGIVFNMNNLNLFFRYSILYHFINFFFYHIPSFIREIVNVLFSSIFSGSYIHCSITILSDIPDGE